MPECESWLVKPGRLWLLSPRGGDPTPAVPLTRKRTARMPARVPSFLGSAKRWGKPRRPRSVGFLASARQGITPSTSLLSKIPLKAALFRARYRRHGHESLYTHSGLCWSPCYAVTTQSSWLESGQRTASGGLPLRSQSSRQRAAGAEEPQAGRSSHCSKGPSGEPIRPPLTVSIPWGRDVGCF